MKKLFFGLLAAIAITACSTEDVKNVNNETQTEITAKGSEAEALTAFKNYYAQEHPGENASTAKINCHTPWHLSSGHACVSIGLSVYEVQWWEVTMPGGNNYTAWYTMPEIPGTKCKC